jgi:hypothetical protein
MRGSVLLLGAVLAFVPQQAQAQDDALTRVMVRVLSRDAKLIGSGVGGAKVTIVNVATGEILAEGVHEGGSGSTGLIMSTPQARGATIYDTEGAAGFVAELRLSEPTVVNISAIGPLGFPQATRAATKQMLLVPGQDVLGDGVILELHGFIVEILAPLPLEPVGDEVEVTARVRMMCGCPIEPGGLWNADAKTIVAHLRADGRAVAQVALRYAGEPNLFRGVLPVPPGTLGRDLTVAVVAAEGGAQNFGRHEIPVSGRQ